jgi:hypothetical protein
MHLHSSNRSILGNSLHVCLNSSDHLLQQYLVKPATNVPSILGRLNQGTGFLTGRFHQRNHEMCTAFLGNGLTRAGLTRYYCTRCLATALTSR